VRPEETAKLLPDQKVTHPDAFWTVVLEIGLLGWIGSMFVLIFLWAGGVKEPKPRYGSPLLWLIAAAACFSLWIMGMFKA
jgi:predicted membrane-bound dolichyl-phosphate-mannose-protein mannosyltransferase